MRYDILIWVNDLLLWVPLLILSWEDIVCPTISLKILHLSLNLRHRWFIVVLMTEQWQLLSILIALFAPLTKCLRVFDVHIFGELCRQTIKLTNLLSILHIDGYLICWLKSIQANFGAHTIGLLLLWTLLIVHKVLDLSVIGLSSLFIRWNGHYALRVIKIQIRPIRLLWKLAVFFLHWQ